MMQITGIIWLHNIVEKLWHKHHVEQEEVVEVLSTDPQLRFVEKGHYADESVYSASGQTIAGRVVRKQDQRALIVSAREMTTAERRRYERR